MRALWLAIKPFYMSVCKHGFRSSFIRYFIKEMQKQCKMVSVFTESPNLPRVYIRLCKHGKHFTFLQCSTREVWRARKMRKSYSRRSREQLLLLEWKMFFLEGFVCWRHERAQWEYEAHSRNWIWLHKFTGYVIILSWNIIDVLRTEKINIGMRRWDRTLWILNVFSLETGKEHNFSSNQNCVENSLSVASSPMWYFFSGVG